MSQTTSPIPRHRGRLVLATALAVVGLLVAGCGSGGDDASPTTTGAGDDDASTTTSTASEPGTDDGATEGGDACDLVSDDIVEEILGTAVSRREPLVDGASIGCVKGTERQDDPANFNYVSVSISAGGASFVDEASAQAGSEPVEGVGDRAVYLEAAGALFAADGGDLVHVQVVKGGVPGNKAEAVAVLEDVLERR